MNDIPPVWQLSGGDLIDISLSVKMFMSYHRSWLFGSWDINGMPPVWQFCNLRGKTSAVGDFLEANRHIRQNYV